MKMEMKNANNCIFVLLFWGAVLDEHSLQKHVRNCAALEGIILLEKVTQLLKNTFKNSKVSLCHPNFF